jgi:5-methylcytosine-specific restriction endonuclease McrA
MRPRFRFRLHPVVIARRGVKGKRCRDCKRFRSPAVRWFHRNKNRPDGLQLYCKDCKRKRDHHSYVNHREERQATYRAWKLEHRPEINAWHRTYIKEYRGGSRRRSSLSSRDSLPSSAVRLCSACGGVFPLDNFPKRGAECRSCWNARQPAYRNPTKRAVYRQNRRARERGVIDSGEWQRVLDRYGQCCAYCGLPGKLTMDHVVPLSRGGKHEISNVVPACSRCNSRKHTKLWTPMKKGERDRRKTGA